MTVCNALRGHKDQPAKRYNAPKHIFFVSKMFLTRHYEQTLSSAIYILPMSVHYKKTLTSWCYLPKESIFPLLLLCLAHTNAGILHTHRSYMTQFEITVMWLVRQSRDLRLNWHLLLAAGNTSPPSRRWYLWSRLDVTFCSPISPGCSLPWIKVKRSKTMLIHGTHGYLCFHLWTWVSWNIHGWNSGKQRPYGNFRVLHVLKSITQSITVPVHST
jgi:hypothetical protein